MIARLEVKTVEGRAPIENGRDLCNSAAIFSPMILQETTSVNRANFAVKSNLLACTLFCFLILTACVSPTAQQGVQGGAIQNQTEPCQKIQQDIIMNNNQNAPDPMTLQPRTIDFNSTEEGLFYKQYEQYHCETRRQPTVPLQNTR